MREKLRNELLLMLNKNIDSTDTLKLLEKEIDCIISNYEIEERKTNIIPYQFIPKEIEYYIVSKKIAGLSEKTLQLYCMVLKNFFKTVRKEPKDVKANDIRVYLYMYQKEHDISNRTLDCKRTIICTFFAWLASEEYIDKDPSVNISAIKYERIHKKAMSQIDLEKIRSACETKREKAIIEMLYSTGCRVTELSRLNISDVNFETKEITLFGKGDKHRVSYLNAKAEQEFTGFKQGNERFQAVVKWIYDLIPNYLRPFFPQKFIEALIQNAFEQSAAYAKKQLDKLVDKIFDKEK